MHLFSQSFPEQFLDSYDGCSKTIETFARA